MTPGSRRRRGKAPVRCAELHFCCVPALADLRDVVRKTRLIFDGQPYTTVSLCLNLPNQNQSKLTKSCRCSPLVDLNYRNLNFHIFLENRSLGRQLGAPKCLVCFCGVALSRNRSAHYIELPVQFIDLGLFSRKPAASSFIFARAEHVGSIEYRERALAHDVATSSIGNSTNVPDG